jgi:hypothetical protein
MPSSIVTFLAIAGLLAAESTTAPAGKNGLAENGKSAYRNVVADGASPSTVHAAKERQGLANRAAKEWIHVCTDAGAGAYEAFPDVCRMADGRLILGLYKESAETAFGAVTFSNDGGTSWQKPVHIPNGGMRLDAETDVIVLKNGDIFAALGGREIRAWSVSKDGGATWSVAKQFGFPGRCHYLLRAPGDIILMAHRLPSTSLHYSLDFENKPPCDRLVTQGRQGFSGT